MRYSPATHITIAWVRERLASSNGYVQVGSRPKLMVSAWGRSRILPACAPPTTVSTPFRRMEAGETSTTRVDAFSDF
jgi:hypothetical protein